MFLCRVWSSKWVRKVCPAMDNFKFSLAQKYSMYDCGLYMHKMVWKSICESFNRTFPLHFRKATSVPNKSSAKTKKTRKSASSEEVGKLNIKIIIINLLLTELNFCGLYREIALVKTKHSHVHTRGEPSLYLLSVSWLVSLPSPPSSSSFVSIHNNCLN